MKKIALFSDSGSTMLHLCSRCQQRFTLLLKRTASRALSSPVKSSSTLDLSKFDPSLIRNFSIIAHVDHGKSTLSDRLLEFTGTIQRSPTNRQVLDRLKIERDRGITIKAQTAALFYTCQRDGRSYLLNLIDTPGHVDFSHEVQRSVAASDGVILLVDASSGVQAQTIANYYLAFSREMPVIPVINKIDLPGAKPMEVKKQLATLFSIEPQEVLEVSAKHGTGIPELLEAIVQRVPPPQQPPPGAQFKALIVDSWFEPYKGAVCLVATKSGNLRPGDQFYSMHHRAGHVAKEMGVFRSCPQAIHSLSCGLVGYLVSGMKSTKEAMVGDTLVGSLDGAEAVDAGMTFQAAQPAVFCGLYPVTQQDIDSLEASLNKLTLNDASVSVAPDSNPALGRGWRLGFLGLLHMDVFRQRLEEEYDAATILTAPSIPYKVRLNSEKAAQAWGHGSELVTVNSPSLMPPESAVAEYFEPVCRATVITPDKYLDYVQQIVLERRGSVLSQSYIDTDRLLLEARLPLSEIVIDLVDQLKLRTSGYASFHYEEAGWQTVQLVKLVPHVNDRPVEELIMMQPVDRARDRAAAMAARLTEELPRQQFLIKIQIKTGNNKVLASGQIKPFRKDVTQKIKSGTDRTRRQKLLEAQREGKRRLRMIGNVEIPRDTFIKVLKSA